MTWKKHSTLITGLLVAALFCGFMQTVFDVDMYFGQGYATQMEVDPTVYRLDNDQGEIVTFVTTKQVPGMGNVGLIPEEGQYTYTWRYRFISKGIIFYFLEVFIPNPWKNK